jgi:hypothetical protein
VALRFNILLSLMIFLIFFFFIPPPCLSLIVSPHWTHCEHYASLIEHSYITLASSGRLCSAPEIHFSSHLSGSEPALEPTETAVLTNAQWLQDKNMCKKQH